VISYTCPRCRAFLTAYDDEVGTKKSCAVCGQRLLIPGPHLPATDKTVLGESVGPPSPRPPDPPVVRPAADEFEDNFDPPPVRPSRRRPPPPARHRRHRDEYDDDDDRYPARRRSAHDDDDDDDDDGYDDDRYRPRRYRRTESVSGAAIAALVLGIVSIPISCIPLFGGIVGLVGLILGAVALNERDSSAGSRGMGTAGLICSIIGVILSLFFFLFFLAEPRWF
jgi:DNA-directed RNA polymerase subunit RPC12/RpoP